MLIGKVMGKYCAACGIELSDVQFLLDGDHIDRFKSVRTLGLEDGDEIDVMPTMHGGR
jgi:molybdopterin converting factor small subunit